MRSSNQPAKTYEGRSFGVHERGFPFPASRFYAVRRPNLSLSPVHPLYRKKHGGESADGCHILLPHFNDDISVVTIVSPSAVSTCSLMALSFAALFILGIDEDTSRDNRVNLHSRFFLLLLLPPLAAEHSPRF